jgi:hypothetical protein
LRRTLEEEEDRRREIIQVQLGPKPKACKASIKNSQWMESKALAKSSFRKSRGCFFFMSLLDDSSDENEIVMNRSLF